MRMAVTVRAMSGGGNCTIGGKGGSNDIMQFQWRWVKQNEGCGRELMVNDCGDNYFYEKSVVQYNMQLCIYIPTLMTMTIKWEEAKQLKTGYLLMEAGHFIPLVVHIWYHWAVEKIGHNSSPMRW